jgi:hypothetical protein
MIQRATANTDIEGATPALKAFFTDTLGIPKEAKLGRLGNFMRWRFQDWQGTALECPEVRLQEPPCTTIDLLEASSQDFHRGPRVFGKFVNITDAYNIVVNVPTSEVSSRKPQVYRQAETSTVEEVEQIPSTIIQQELTRYVEKTINRLFESAEEQYFEDGMESDFSRELVSLVKKYRNLVMGEISYLITCGRVDEEVASEALRWLGRIDDTSTHGWRLWVLEKSLSSKSPVVRDGAALGSVYMGDAHAMQYIKKAIEQETIAELRYDLQGALKELEASLNAIPTTDDKKA